MFLRSVLAIAFALADPGMGWSFSTKGSDSDIFRLFAGTVRDHAGAWKTSEHQVQVN